MIGKSWFPKERDTWLVGFPYRCSSSRLPWARFLAPGWIERGGRGPRGQGASGQSRRKWRISTIKADIQNCMDHLKWDFWDCTGRIESTMVMIYWWSNQEVMIGLNKMVIGPNKSLKCDFHGDPINLYNQTKGEDSWSNLGLKEQHNGDICIEIIGSIATDYHCKLGSKTNTYCMYIYINIYIYIHMQYVIEIPGQR